MTEIIASEVQETKNGCELKNEKVEHKESLVQCRKFGPRTDALTILADVDLTGRTILITGCSSGIGVETARSLALKGAHVVMANRNIIESEKIRDIIKKEKPDAELDILNVDLSSLQSVRAAAKEFMSKKWPLHVLILNAGVFAPVIKSTIDGYEMCFGVNHLGHFYLTFLLLQKIRESAPARIVIVSSHSHKHTGLAPSLSTEEKLERLVALSGAKEMSYKLYAYSKLCNVLMAMKLHRMENENKINVYVLHPGTMIGTGIARGYGIWAKVVNTLSKPLTKTVQQGAATTVYCAASKDVENESGFYYESCWIDDKNLAKVLACDEWLQDALWKKSLDLIHKYENKNPIL